MFCQLCGAGLGNETRTDHCFMCTTLIGNTMAFEHTKGTYMYSWSHYWDEDQAKRVARGLEDRFDFISATPRKKKGTAFWDMRLKKDRPSPMIKSALKGVS